jgi:hypothetical protein
LLNYSPHPHGEQSHLPSAVIEASMPYPGGQKNRLFLYNSRSLFNGTFPGFFVIREYFNNLMLAGTFLGIHRNTPKWDFFG